MITYDDNPESFERACHWSHETFHPDEDYESASKRFKWFYESAGTLMTHFYQDGTHVVSMALIRGISPHYGEVLDVHTAMPKDTVLSTSVKRELLKYAKAIAKANDIHYLVRSSHLTSNTERVITTKI